MIEAGTTCAVDTSQVNHTPEHSDAAIRAHQEAGLRVVYAYSRGAGPRSQYPRDIERLKRTAFSSEDQLLTLAPEFTLGPRAARTRGRARSACAPSPTAPTMRASAP